MLLAHKVELRPTPAQVDYLEKACGHRRHCWNHMRAWFSQRDSDGNLIFKWSKTAAYQFFMKVLRVEFPWYSEVSSVITRNVIDDLDNAFKNFFRRVKKGEKPGYPKPKKKGVKDGFAIRENRATPNQRKKVLKMALPFVMLLSLMLKTKRYELKS